MCIRDSPCQRHKAPRSRRLSPHFRPAGGYVCLYGACGDNSVATKRNLVEILGFRHFSRHAVFDAEGDKFGIKRIEGYNTASEAADMEHGNTKNETVD